MAQRDGGRDRRIAEVPGAAAEISTGDGIGDEIERRRGAAIDVVDIVDGFRFPIDRVFALLLEAIPSVRQYRPDMAAEGFDDWLHHLWKEVGHEEGAGVAETEGDEAERSARSRTFLAGVEIHAKIIAIPQIARKIRHPFPFHNKIAS